jgi:CBS domain-containing protein
MALDGAPAAWATLTEFPVLEPDHTLAAAASLFLHRAASSVPVMTAGRVVGVVTRQDVARGLASAGERSSVGNVMRDAFVEADEAEPLLEVVERISREGADLAVVSRDGRMAGIVTLDVIENLVLFRGALRDAPVARTMQASVA